jgi:hypothetical protein
MIREYLPPAEKQARLQSRLSNIEKYLKMNYSQSKIGAEIGLSKNQVAGLISRHLRGYLVRQKIRDVPPETRNHEVLPEKVILTPLHADVDFEPPEGKFNIWNIKV